MKKRGSFGIRVRKSWLAAVLLSLFCWAATGSIAAAQPSVIKLKYGSYGPQSDIDDPVLWYLNEVAKRSDIKIEVETYFSGILGKPTDCLDALGSGVYDIGWISPVFTPAKTPLAMIPGSTPLVAPNLYGAAKAADEVVRTFPPAAEEFKKANVKYLFWTGVWKYELISTKPVKSLADLKGLRVRTFGYQAKAVAQLGGVPVTIPISEAYDALQKGVIDGVLTQPYAMYKSLRLFEVAKNYTDVDFGCLPATVIMNMGTWNELPEKVRKEMIALAAEMPAMDEKIIGGTELKALEDMQKQGLAVYSLPASDKVRIAEVGKGIAKMFVNDLEKKGIADAGEVMDIYLKALDTYAAPK